MCLLEVTIRPRDKPGMNGEVQRLLRRSNRLNRIAKRSNNVDDILNHQIARREAKVAWRKAQKDHYLKFANSINLNESYNGAKKQWKILKSLYVTDKTSNINSLIDGDIYYLTDSSKAECLNNFFASPSRIDISKEPDLPRDIHYSTASRLSDVSVSD